MNKLEQSAIQIKQRIKELEAKLVLINSLLAPVETVEVADVTEVAKPKGRRKVNGVI